MLPVAATPYHGVPALRRHVLRFAPSPAIAGWAARAARARRVSPSTAWSLAAPRPSGHVDLNGADDVLHLNAPARVVVLAACDTATVAAQFADEGLGLATAFHIAGVPGVIATLWSIPDQEAAAMMSDLGGRLLGGEDPAAALGAAALGARERGDDIGVWAAFVLLGA